MGSLVVLEMDGGGGGGGGGDNGSDLTVPNDSINSIPVDLYCESSFFTVFLSKRGKLLKIASARLAA